MGDKNPIRTLGDYSKPSHEGYRNTIELLKGKNMVPLRSDTIRLVQNGCAFHGLMSEDPIQHLKDFLRIVNSINLNGSTRNTTRLHLFFFSLRDQAINWLDGLPAGSISTLDDLTKESLYDAWTRFKDLLQKVPHHGLDFWLQVQIFYDFVDSATQMVVDYTADGRLRKLRPEEAWETIKDLAQYKEEWNQPIFSEKGSPDYINATLEQELGSMEHQLIEKAEGESKLEDVSIVRNFLEVFPEDLPGLPPTQQVEFQIDLVLGATPVARSLYRLAVTPRQRRKLRNAT
ncbi:hypothetical protein Tco_0276631 [Tanacetum coccineum]